MRILYDARLAGRGLGITTFILSLADALIESGEVELVWLGDPALAPPGIRAAVRFDRRPYPLLDGPAGRAFARRARSELIHFTANTGWTVPGPVPSVLTLHDLIYMGTGIRSRSPRQIVGHRYERQLVPRAVASAGVLVVPSHTVAASARERLGLQREVRVIYEGAPAIEPRATCDGTPYIVAFAGRDPRKQTMAVVNAWRELTPSPLRLTLLGAGGLPPRLEDTLVAELASGQVEIRGHIPRGELLSLLRGALALVYPSTDEGFGLPVLEAMAMGTPVLTGLAPVTREVGGAAIVQLDPGDVVGSIVAAVRRLQADPDELAAVSARGTLRAQQFSWEATAAAYVQAYKDAAGRG